VGLYFLRKATPQRCVYVVVRVGGTDWLVEWLPWGVRELMVYAEFLGEKLWTRLATDGLLMVVVAYVRYSV
jgi:hypothetical protein